MVVRKHIRVATVLTVYGIETSPQHSTCIAPRQLQQYLPFTVLKHIRVLIGVLYDRVATVLTVYGIETRY